MNRELWFSLVSVCHLKNAVALKAHLGYSSAPDLLHMHSNMAGFCLRLSTCI